MGLSTGSIGGIANGVGIIGGVLFGDDFPSANQIEGVVTAVNDFADKAGTIYDGFTGSGTPAPVPQDGTHDKVTKEQTAKKHPNGTPMADDEKGSPLVMYAAVAAGVLVLYMVLR